MTSDKIRLSKPWMSAYAATATFAAVLVWVVGHRGVFLLDQSILFDGAWRVYQGQVPYRDFVTAFPPMAFYIQASFFHLAGVDVSATVLAGALVNVVATVCVIWITRRLLPELPAIALAAGLLTAVWFQAPFGTLWFEQTAFVFNCVAMAVLVRCADAEGRHAIALRVIAGLLLCGSMLSKQNAGAEFIPVALALAAMPHMTELRKATISAVQTLMGVALGFSAFAAWLWLFSSPAQFWHSYIELARQIGADRIELRTTVWRVVTIGATWPYVIVPLLALAFSLFKLRSAPGCVARRLLVCIVVGCILFQNLFKLHTDNEIENSLPFLGLIYGLSFGLFWKHVLTVNVGAASWIQTAMYPPLAVTLVLTLYAGLWHSWHRTVQQFAPGTSFVHTLSVPGMSRVKWGDATRYGHKSTLTRQEFEALNAWLDEVNENFFVFPDSTILYGIHGRVSPQPWLYFSPGHSFLESELLRVDERVVKELRRNGVRIVILEHDSWVNNENLWKRMPRLSAWLDGDFERSRQFGIYEVRRLKAAP